MVANVRNETSDGSVTAWRARRQSSSCHGRLRKYVNIIAGLPILRQLDRIRDVLGIIRRAAEPLAPQDAPPIFTMRSGYGCIVPDGVVAFSSPMSFGVYRCDASTFFSS